MNTKGIEKSKLHFARLSDGEIESIHTLAKMGLSLKQISARLHVPRATIYHHAKKYCRKITQLKLAALSEKECGYLVGMFVGDGIHIIKLDKGTYLTKFSLDKARDKDIEEYMQVLFAKTSKRIGRRIERNSITLKVFSKEFVEFLSEYVRHIEQNNTRRKRKMLINHEKWPSAFKLGFISGLIDSDGHVYFDQMRGKRFGVLIRTADNDLRDQIISLLMSLSIATTTYPGKHHEKSYSSNPQYVIYIPTKELSKVAETLIAAKLKRWPAASIS